MELWRTLSCDTDPPRIKNRIIINYEKKEEKEIYKKYLKKSNYVKDIEVQIKKDNKSFNSKKGNQPPYNKSIISSAGNIPYVLRPKNRPWFQESVDAFDRLDRLFDGEL